MSIGIPSTMRQVKRPGGIYVWEGPRPKDIPFHDKFGPRDDDDFWDELGATLAAVTPMPASVHGVICHCGCLLIDESETCPACLVWAINDAAKHSWRAAENMRRKALLRYEKKIA